MANFYLNNEAVSVLQQIHLQLSSPTSLDYNYELFASNFTPAFTDTYASYILNSVFSYTTTPQVVTNTSWSGSTTAGVATYTAPTLIWTFTANPGPINIWGVWGYIQSTGFSPYANFGAQVFGSASVIPAGGGVFAWTPTWTEFSA